MPIKKVKKTDVMFVKRLKKQGYTCSDAGHELSVKGTSKSGKFLVDECKLKKSRYKA